MTKTDIIDFLELPVTASDADIQKRALEKQQFFQRLIQSAPNATVKALHTRNAEKVQTILQIMGVSAVAASSAIDTPVFQAATVQSSAAMASNNHQTAFLIRHTENKPVKSFPLRQGKNLIGRDAAGLQGGIIINDDAYVSRKHAVLEVANGQYYLTDGIDSVPSKNGVFVNAQKIRGRVLLKANDTIQIGETKLVLKLPQQNSNVQQLEKEVDDSEYMKTVIINLL